VTYVFLKLVTGKAREVHPLMWLVSIAFAIFFMVPWIETMIG
jgi:adenine/guanine/hypoxanthine permease